MPLASWLAACLWSFQWNECGATDPSTSLLVRLERAALVQFACQTLWSPLGLCWDKAEAHLGEQ